MFKFGVKFRLLVLAVCLVPFTSSQQARGALAPFLPLTPVLTSEIPVAPNNEEEEEREERGGREEANGKERQAPLSRVPVLDREFAVLLPSLRAPHRPHVTKPRTTPPVAADPFRNGLGTPYRC